MLPESKCKMRFLLATHSRVPEARVSRPPQSKPEVHDQQKHGGGVCDPAGLSWRVMAEAFPQNPQYLSPEYRWKLGQPLKVNRVVGERMVRSHPEPYSPVTLWALVCSSENRSNLPSLYILPRFCVKTGAARPVTGLWPRLRRRRQPRALCSLRKTSRSSNRNTLAARLPAGNHGRGTWAHPPRTSLPLLALGLSHARHGQQMAMQDCLVQGSPRKAGLELVSGSPAADSY